MFSSWILEELLCSFTFLFEIWTRYYFVWLKIWISNIKRPGTQENICILGLLKYYTACVQGLNKN